MRRRSREGWVYWVLLILAALFLGLFGWPIAKKVIVHDQNVDVEDVDARGGGRDAAVTRVPAGR